MGIVILKLCVTRLKNLSLILRGVLLSLNTTMGDCHSELALASEESIESLLLDSNKLKNLKALIKFSN
ncbi:hypothetical protein [Helicobacter sp. MIT 14-3879]|uniref:hypothetical protein n=1 Tax=Helicobacter sp. MIT 14-3879 TaxID=2040649 RepID=UPI0011C05395|nr:hypothetical protein [Helicobacter sp. MIT 14-3879]